MFVKWTMPMSPSLPRPQSGRWMAAALGAVRRWNFRRRTRLGLAGLTERELADIGITWAEARQESDKPFWSK